MTNGATTNSRVGALDKLRAAKERQAQQTRDKWENVEKPLLAEKSRLFAPFQAGISELRARGIRIRNENEPSLQDLYEFRLAIPYMGGMIVARVYLKKLEHKPFFELEIYGRGALKPDPKRTRVFGTAEELFDAFLEEVAPYVELPEGHMGEVRARSK